MAKNVIAIDNLIAESAANAAMEFASAAMTDAVYRIINESGGISKNELKTIENLYTKIITEAMDEFVPSEDEIKDMIKKLEAAGYKVVVADNAKKAENGAQAAGNAGDGNEELNESVDLASKIAAKLEIL